MRSSASTFAWKRASRAAKSAVVLCIQSAPTESRACVYIAPPGVPVLQPPHQHLEEFVRATPVHDAMIERQRHIAARLDDEAILAVLRHHRRALFELAHPENGRLRLIDHDRRCNQA